METDRATTTGPDTSSGPAVDGSPRVIDAVAFKYRNNLAWRDLPDECFLADGVDRFTHWARDGT